MKHAAFLLALCLAAPLAGQDSIRVVQLHSPAAAGLFSAIVPGGGQAYNGQWEKAVIFFGGEILLYAAAVNAENDGETGDAFGFTLIGMWGVSIVDAVLSARKLNVEALRVTPTVALDGRVGLAVSFSP